MKRMTHVFPYVLPFHNTLFFLLVPRPRTKKQLEIEERIQQAVQAAYKRNGPVKPVEESHLMSERSSRFYLLGGTGTVLWLCFPELQGLPK